LQLDLIFDDWTDKSTVRSLVNNFDFGLDVSQFIVFDPFRFDDQT
jgi:hypothetical protein